MPTLDFLFKRSSPTVCWCKILENTVVFSIKKKKKKGGMHSLHSISVRVVEFFKLALLRLLWISGQKIQLLKRVSDNVRRPCWPLRMWLPSYNGMCPSAVLTGSCRLSCCKYIAVWWAGLTLMISFLGVLARSATWQWDNVYVMHIYVHGRQFVHFVQWKLWT